MSLREELTTIYQRRHALTPAVVVDEARPAEAPLHHRFEWDDSVAGEAYRQQQAADLIRSVHVRFTPEPDNPQREVRVRAFVPVQDANRYVPVDEVGRSQDLTNIVLAQMEREWRQLRRKYQAHAEFWALVQSEAEQHDAA